MKKIVLVCAAGMSTSMMVKKMQEVAKEDNYECTIEAHPIAEASEVGKDADIMLLGPQVRFQLGKVKELVNCPVEAIDMAAYGTMDGKKVMDFVKGVIGE